MLLEGDAASIWIGPQQYGPNLCARMALDVLRGG